ncbi:Rpn family recombination-promoting nuclease/putative transposase [Segatella copri]|jgi:predicted transposase/invertase (TIGR01784 family)|uniref:Rpn family recombination-promoting nuclease/putative transposase n=4 Tax=Segatella TaxID=2974251 RepID=A0A3R6FAR5_9BACT|nr:Rpn family recombination-promoting nuclease/putative transposase [Segatella copri]
MGRYINPFTDWGFKRLFGQEFSKDLLINFLNDLFEGEFQIKDVTFKDKEQLGDTNDLRGCIFDIYCVTDDDKHFIVEMQNRWVPFFVNRSIYYASKAFVAQRKKFDEAGVRTAILYQFVPVYVVCIMNFMPKEHEVTKFRTDVALREKSSDSIFSDKLRFIYLSLPFFDKSEEECETGFEKWIYVLKYMEVLERLPFTAQKKIFDHLAKLADVRCLSSEEQEKYDESIKAADDYYSGLYGSYVEGEEKGIAKGRAEGIAKGRAEGIAKGRAEGMAKGMAKEKLDTAYRLLSMGLSEAQVSTATELPLEEIQKMRK